MSYRRQDGSGQRNEKEEKPLLVEIGEKEQSK